MHALFITALQQALEGTALTAAQAAALIGLLPEHTLDLLAVARVMASTSRAAPFTCGIINAKSGRCAENCRFCAQSMHHATQAPAYPLVSRDTLLVQAERFAGEGAAYMGIVTSGTGPVGRDFDALCHAAAYITARVDIKLCASFGILTAAQAVALKQAGYASCHHNIETARSHYPAICTTHGFDARIRTVRNAQAAGLRVCSGGIFGLGESWAQRIEMAAELGELQVDSVPVNFLTPIPGTPLENSPPLPPGEALGLLALLRLMLPGRDIVVCGGRAATLREWQNLVFSAGANGIMVGDYLTTPGSALEHDRAMLRTLGLRP
ncbi:MAG: biotin synthase BioB [Desulfovibrionaceae bacterium]